MSIYDPLREHLRGLKTREVMLGFREIEDIIGRALPESAKRPQFWANVTSGGGPQREACRAAGFESFLISGSSYKVRFVRRR